MFSSDLLLLILQIYIKSPILSISMNPDLGAIVFLTGKYRNSSGITFVVITVATLGVKVIAEYNSIGFYCVI